MRQQARAARHAMCCAMRDAAFRLLMLLLFALIETMALTPLHFRRHAVCFFFDYCSL